MCGWRLDLHLQRNTLPCLPKTAQADLQTVKADLISAEEVATDREKEVERLRKKLESE